jgi:putative methyltransferase (TIGR04325 family)
MKNIYLINKIYNLPFSNNLTGFIKKKLLKKNNIIFIPTKLKKLPQNNHPIQNSIGLQEDIIKNYNKDNKLSFNTFPKLKLLLKKKFKADASFNFLDFGGDKLDFYLDLSKEFKNINYFLINLPEVNKIIDTLKKKYNYQNLTVLNDLNEIQRYQYDFVYFGSTLQYLDDYNNFLLNILPITKKYIMFSATHFFTDNNTFEHLVVKQLNFLPKLYYLYFFNLDNFSKQLKEYHFNIEFNHQNESHDIKYDSFKYLNIKNIKYTDILFSKNS